MSTKVAAVAVVLALAGLAAYTMFSGPTTVSTTSQSGTTKSTPSKVAPAGEEQSGEGREGGGG
jgi:hypothetical protein